jgi:hypothetical protein
MSQTTAEFVMSVQKQIDELKGVEFWNGECQAFLRPTPCLKFKTVYEPAPQYGENVHRGVRVLHQKFLNITQGGEIWLPVEMEE